jgi:hypothetical protein
LVPNQTPSFATHLFLYLFIYLFFFASAKLLFFHLIQKKKKQRKMMDYTSCETPLTDIKTETSKEEPTCDKAVNMLLAKLDEVFFLILLFVKINKLMYTFSGHSNGG